MYNQFTNFNNTKEKVPFQQKSKVILALSFPCRREGFCTVFALFRTLGAVVQCQVFWWKYLSAALVLLELVQSRPVQPLIFTLI